jgi:hypothetical protein
MRVRNEESGNGRELRFVTTYISVNEENKLSMLKRNASFERKIERLWFRSKTLGWNYNDFAVHILEVLVVLRRRDNVKRAAALKAVR